MKNIFESIAPTDLRDFLKSRGWFLVDEAIKDGLYVLNNSHYNRRQLGFPIDDSSADYIDCVETVIKKLADIESISLQNIVTELSEMKDDTIGFRIVDSRDEASFISLNYALNAIKGAKDMLSAAACSAVKPQISHPRMNRQEAQQIVESSRFRHTEKGSFVIKVSTPVKALEEIHSDIFGNEIPFVRQTTLLINKSVYQLVNAIQTDRLEALVDNLKNEPKPILSTNICKALLNFQEENNKADLYLNFHWAGIIAKPNDAANFIKIQKDYYSRIDDIRKELSSQESDREDIFVGRVEQLLGILDKNEQRAGDVLLDIYQQDGESIRVRVNLKAEWHKMAIKAYENASYYIQVKGRILAGNSKSKMMTEVSDFKIIDENNL
jgi:hypothetical protein